MDKLNNVDTCMSTEFIPSYEEIVSFSGKDVDKLVQSGLNCNSCDGIDSYNLRIKLFGNDNCDNGVLNSLILDNVGKKYSYIKGTASFNNNCFNPDFNMNGVFTEVFSGSEDGLLKLSLSNSRCDNLNECSFRSINHGFNLSEIVDNIGNFNDLKHSCKDSRGSICINQRIRLLNRCGRCYVICNFNLLNRGNDLAQKILFKDVFPENVFVNERNVFLDGCRICSKEIFLDKNRMIIKLPDLDVGKNLNLTIVGMLCMPIRRFNFATISYVSSYSKHRNRSSVDISQKMSNIKII